nr:hypothetical protein [Tanacetum cinerariifolium]
RDPATHQLRFSFSCRDQASSASINEAATSGVSSNERNQTYISARTLMSLPRASNVSSQVHANQRDQASSASANEAAASGMSSNERNQTDISAHTLMSPPRASNVSSQVHANQRDQAFSASRNEAAELLALHRAISSESDFGTSTGEFGDPAADAEA